MSRPWTIRQPTTTENCQRYARLEAHLHPCQRRRVEAMILYATDRIAVESAPALAVHPHTLYADLRHDPCRQAILSRWRWLGRHLPPHSVLLCFAGQPLAVKADGGRRYSLATRGIFAREQKTRGRFSLFVVSGVGSGRSRWAYWPGKSSASVCQGMRQVRRWYPDQAGWGALDHDPAHPRKSRKTRQPLRTLQRHGGRWPKGRPDDNPVDTLCSAIQLMRRDNRHEADGATTQQRLRAPLRGRNRRQDRRMHIVYLSSSPSL